MTSAPRHRHAAAAGGAVADPTNCSSKGGAGRRENGVHDGAAAVVSSFREVEHRTPEQVRLDVATAGQRRRRSESKAEKEKKVAWTRDPRKLLTFDEIPDWMKDNEDIKTGYRSPTFSYSLAARTLLFIHNETGNIYSHFLGALFFVYLAVHAGLSVLSDTKTVIWSDLAVIYVFMAGAILCMGCSGYFHLMSCHSEPVCRHLNRCDYIGIVFLIVGSFYPAVYYGFFCHPVFKFVYLASITSLGAATVVMCASLKFRTPEFRWMRTGLFIALGAAGIIPVGHGVYLYGLSLAVEAVSLKHLLAMGTVYIVGALIYASRIPESLAPGKFDIWCHSHQIFHCCVVVAAYIHFAGILNTFKYWHDQNHSCATDIEQMVNNYIS